MRNKINHFSQHDEDNMSLAFIIMILSYHAIGTSETKLQQRGQKRALIPEQQVELISLLPRLATGVIGVRIVLPVP